ncbi:PREDICTED: venom protease-like isoform X1 [Bactrocera latifrons]|nr:PREDICTED: venom protease-like isoform X1 [Bactrocera latifrons]
MPELRFKLFACLSVAFYCNLSIIAGNYACKENDYFGYCKLYENCPSLQGTPLTKDMLNPKDCRHSILSGPVICCPRRRHQQRPNRSPSKTTTTTTTTERTSRRYMRIAFNKETNIGDLKNIHPEGLALLNKPNCGKINDNRVANGICATQGEFPWMAVLLYARMGALCGGSVITERFVLTAAHCISNDFRKAVRLGEHRRSTKIDCILHICQTHVDFEIDPHQKPIIHPDYKSLDYHKDIALIKLNMDIDFRRYQHIAPICLPLKSSDSNISPHDNLVLAGWGLQEHDRSVDVLQKGQLRLKGLDICKNLYPRFRIDNSKLCIQAGANQTVSCRGDSGGPLFWKTPFLSGNFIKKHYTQIGLVSLGYGKECGDLTSEPFMYENVTDSMVWITHSLYKAHFHNENPSIAQHYFYSNFMHY